MAEWAVDEHRTRGGKSHFAEFVAGLDDSRDIRDAVVSIGALRSLGNQLREPRSKSLGGGLFELRGTRSPNLLRILAGTARRAGRGLREETH